MSIKSDITATLKQVSELEDQFSNNPFEGERAEALGNVAVAETMLAELAGDPENMKPSEIIEGRRKATDALEIARIELARAEAKIDPYFSLLNEKLRELNGDALDIIDRVVTDFEKRIEAAVIELADGYWGNFQVGYSEPISIARHRSRGLKTQKRIIDRNRIYDVPQMAKLQQIRTALEACSSYLA